MRTKIISRSTGETITVNRELQDALLTAIRLGVDNSDMLFIVGATNITLHKYASQNYHAFGELIVLHQKYQTTGWKVDLAPHRRDLWQRIKESRELKMSTHSTIPLSEFIGNELAQDIELLLQHKESQYVRMPGIDRQEVWKEAFSSAGLLAKRHCDLQFDILVHELLGIIVIAPSDYFAGRNSFTRKSSVGPRRRR